MHRLTTLFACLMLFLSLGLGSVAHADEGIACIEGSATSSLSHSDGDADQVLADADKAYPHHHGGCHGHHVGVPIGEDPVAFLGGLRLKPLTWNDDFGASGASYPALRPPQA